MSQSGQYGVEYGSFCLAIGGDHERHARITLIMCLFSHSTVIHLCHAHASCMQYVLASLQEAALRLQAHQAVMAARSDRECADILACSGELDAAEAATDLVGAAQAGGAPSRYSVRALPA